MSGDLLEALDETGVVPVDPYYRGGVDIFKGYCRYLVDSL
jgi:hypothetical protein